MSRIRIVGGRVYTLLVLDLRDLLENLHFGLLWRVVNLLYLVPVLPQVLFYYFL